MKDFRMGIKIKEINSDYERTIYDSGYNSVTDTINKVNKVIADKFGTDEQLEITRRHKRRRD